MNRILIIKIHSLGDMLLATPAFRAVRRAYPKAEITVLTGSWASPVLEENPDLDELLVVPDRVFFKPDWFGLARLAFGLRRRRFDAILAFHRVPAMHRFARAVGARQRIGWSVDGRTGDLTQPVQVEGPGSTLLEQGVRIAEAAGAPRQGEEMTLILRESERARARELLAEAGWRPGMRLVAAAPGGGRNPRTFMAQKLWTVAGFGRVVEWAAGAHAAKVILVGGASDRERANEVLAAAKVSPGERERLNLAGRTTVREMAALVGEVDLLVTNDSLPLHVAAALRTPVLGVFGPTEAKHLLPRDGACAGIQSPVPCSPCYWGILRDFVPCRPTVCMDSIPVDQVLAGMDRMLAAPASSS